MIKIMVLVHVLAGSVAVLGMIAAITTKKGSQYHRLGGRAYVYGMAISLVLATVVSILTVNIFLLLIALFSAYLVYTGWRLALVKDGKQTGFDRRMAIAMIGVSFLMAAYGVLMLLRGETMGVALIVFGVFAVQPAWADYKSDLNWPKGRERIVLHLSRMGGGCIATVTAVFVVNIQTDPAFIAWLLPSLVGTPLIFYAARKAV